VIKYKSNLLKIQEEVKLRKEKKEKRKKERKSERKKETFITGSSPKDMCV